MNDSMIWTARFLARQRRRRRENDSRTDRAVADSDTIEVSGLLAEMAYQKMFPDAVAIGAMSMIYDPKDPRMFIDFSRSDLRIDVKGTVKEYSPFKPPHMIIQSSRSFDDLDWFELVFPSKEGMWHYAGGISVERIREGMPWRSPFDSGGIWIPPKILSEFFPEKS
jgi:hypothetical protein